MNTASLKRSSPTTQSSEAPKARRRRSKASPATRGSWSKKPVIRLFNESGEINVNIMLGLLFDFLKDYDHSIELKD
ncbi:MAG: hypothetical protein CJBNEKGG_01534 [Prosthecobacter sp.]|nr:hypothetical protein [Prosthecobacter sp.]